MLFENMQLGHYQLLRQIGSGGMGEIYLAEDTRISRQVAIKIVRNEISPYPNTQAAQEAARLFQREMKAISRLDHPHILSLYDFGEANINGLSLSYMVMPFRPEGSLADWLAKRVDGNLLSLDDVAAIVNQAADALQEAHNQQMIHQDIKPSNFLIRSRRGNQQRPDLLLADFGVSKLTSATATASQTVRGTPAYMPPEQWEGQTVAATDQYALAVMTYQLLTGQLPFQGNAMQVMRQHLTTQPTPPSTLRSAIPPALDAVILRALTKDPEKRFPSISDFAQAFQQALSEKPVEEQPAHLQPDIEQRPATVSQKTPISASPSADTPAASSPLAPSILPHQQETILPPRESQNLPPTVEVSASRNLPPTVAVPQAQKPQQKKKPWLLPTALAIVVILTSIIGLSSYQQHVNTVNAEGTATAEAIDAANATATFVAANPYPSYLPGKGTALISDPLSLHKNWSEYTDSSFGGACTFQNGALHVTLTPSFKTFSACHAGQDLSNDPGSGYYNIMADNFAFEVQMNIISGNCGGLFFRENDNNAKYMFEVCQDGTYSLNYWVDTKFLDATRVVYPTPSSAINSGLNQSNTIAAVANGSTITLFANQQQLTSINDSSASKGYLGLLADVNDTPGVIAYTNAKIWQL